MRQVAKVVSPIIVLLALVIFPENQTKYVVPTAFLIAIVSSLYLLCKPLRENENTAGILLFWLSPLALLWLLSERKEGRDINPISITLELVIAGVGTVLLVARNGLKKSDWSLFAAIFLTWAVAYLSGSTGGADNMSSYLNFFGLSTEQLNNLVIVVRKTIHVSFYGTLGFLFLTYLSDKVSNSKNLYWLSFAFCFYISLADEARQSLMPNRGGTVSDVVLDMSATLLVLSLVARKRTKKQRNSTST